MKNRKNRPVNGKVFRSGVYSTAILAAAILLAVLVNLVVRAHSVQIHGVRPFGGQDVHPGRQLGAAGTKPAAGCDHLLSV